MNQLTTRRPGLGMPGLLAAVALGATALLVLLMGAPSKADASTTPYCGNQTLGSWGSCKGAARNLDTVLGWGDQHSVCVSVLGGATSCSSGPGASTINYIGECGKWTPEIWNNAPGSNTVHGVTYDCTMPAPSPPKTRHYMLGVSSGSGIAPWFEVLNGMGETYGMAIGDVSGDGKDDVVAVERDGSNYRYMLGTSTGAGLSWNYTNLTGMARPQALALGDVNGDGKDDLVAVEAEGGGFAPYRYMLGISNGYNFAWGYTSLSKMSPPEQIALGDVNGDGKDDIVATEQSGSYFNYMVGTSSGTNFGWSSTNLKGMWTPYQMGLGDVNGDGKADIVAAEATNNNPGGGTYEYKLGISGGSTSFTWQSTNLKNLWKPYGFGVGDVNGDGLADIVALEAKENNLFTGSYSYAFGIRNGSSFTWGGALSGLSPQEQVGVGDVTGDGKADVVGVEYR